MLQTARLPRWLLRVDRSSRRGTRRGFLNGRTDTITFVWTDAIFFTLIVGYLVFRLSFSVRSARARREGDVENADRLSQQGAKVFLTAAFGMVVVFFVVFAVILR